MNTARQISDSQSSSTYSPTQRNTLWRTMQFLLQNLFAFWLRYRAYQLNNLPTTGGGLIIINHQSYLDPLLIGLPLQRPVSFLARDSLFKIPLIGWILRHTYVMPINRDSASTGSMRECLKRMEQGYLVGMFPEGTRSRDGEIGILKPGFMMLLRRSSLPIYPVGIAGAYDAFPKGAWFIKPRPVCVVYGPAISRQELAPLLEKGQEEQCLNYIRERLQHCLNQANHLLQANTNSHPHSP